MELDVNEIAYNNKVRGTFHDISVEGDDKRIRVKVNDPLLSGIFSFKYDEIRQLWAKLVELDKESALKINKSFDDTLYEANNLANKLSLDKYEEDDKQKIEDMKKFVVLFSELAENAKLRIVASQDKPKEKIIIQRTSQEQTELDKKQAFDDDAKKVSEQFDSKFPQKHFEGNAISFEQLLTKLEEEKKKVKEEQEKRMEELKKLASEKKETITMRTLQTKKPINTEQKEIHVNSDFIKVDPLIKDEKEMKEFKKRSRELDVIDYSKL